MSSGSDTLPEQKQQQKQRPVLISGAGPTGLLFALWLQRFGIAFRLVDRAPTSGTTSRALILHARTLELYRQLGIDGEIVAAGIRIRRFVFHHNRKRKAQIDVSESGKGLSKYPFILSIPQDRHEAILEDILLRRGVKVERGIKVVGCKHLLLDGETDVSKATAVAVRLSRTKETRGEQQRQSDEDETGGDETFFASYVIGSDGAHSAVRACCASEGGIRMEGGTYERAFFVADIRASGPAAPVEEIHMCLSNEDFCMVIPMRERGRVRLIGFVPTEVEARQRRNPDDAKLKPSFEDVRETVARNSAVVVDEVNWFSTYKVHHRVASAFRHGRMFLLGDAAHLHSPVGGQGMNTGLGDATNLAWKLASVFGSGGGNGIHGPAADELLDTYEMERIAFARTLVNTTDRIFTFVTGSGLLSRFLRNLFLPAVLPVVTSMVKLGPRIYRRTSQIEIKYPQSPASQVIPFGDGGKRPSRGPIRPGDRLPWVQKTVRRRDTSTTETGSGGQSSTGKASKDVDGGREGTTSDPTPDSPEQQSAEADNGSDNHAYLATSPSWQFHVYGDTSMDLDALRQLGKDYGVSLCAFTWISGAGKAGLVLGAVYLVRPDGYIGAIVRLQKGERSDEKPLEQLRKYCDKWVGGNGL